MWSPALLFMCAEVAPGFPFFFTCRLINLPRNFMSRQRKVSDAAHYIAQSCSFCAVMLGVMRVCSRDFRSRCQVYAGADGDSLRGVFRGACITACRPTDSWAIGPCCTHFLSIKLGSRLCTSFGLHEGVAGEARSAVRVECPTRAGICLVALVYRHRHFRWRASSAVSTAECGSLNTFRVRG